MVRRRKAWRIGFQKNRLAGFRAHAELHFFAARGQVLTRWQQAAQQCSAACRLNLAPSPPQSRRLSLPDVPSVMEVGCKGARTGPSSKTDAPPSKEEQTMKMMMIGAASLALRPRAANRLAKAPFTARRSARPAAQSQVRSSRAVRAKARPMARSSGPPSAPMRDARGPARVSAALAITAAAIMIATTIGITTRIPITGTPTGKTASSVVMASADIAAATTSTAARSNKAAW